MRSVLSCSNTGQSTSRRELCNFVILVISRIWVLIASVHDLCILFTCTSIVVYCISTAVVRWYLQYIVLVLYKYY